MLRAYDLQQTTSKIKDHGVRKRRNDKVTGPTATRYISFNTTEGILAKTATTQGHILITELHDLAVTTRHLLGEVALPTRHRKGKWNIHAYQAADRASMRCRIQNLHPGEFVVQLLHSLLLEAALLLKLLLHLVALLLFVALDVDL